jgi:signal peptidase I
LTETGEKEEERVEERPVDEPGSPRSVTREWLTALFIALFAALFIRAFVVEAFRIPTPSMESSLLVGDFVLVSKLHYGPRAPVTLGIPFTSLYSTRFELPYLRLPGFTRVRRGDVCVFNFPPEVVPVDRKTHYIKRIVALPGDIVEIREKDLYVNGELVEPHEALQYEYVAVAVRDGSVLPTSLLDLGASNVGSRVRGRDRLSFISTRAVADSVMALPNIRLVEPMILSPDAPRNRTGIYPPGSPFSRDVYGPLMIPARRDTLLLTDESIARYASTIRRFEGVDITTAADGSPLVDGEHASIYVFRRNYYFSLGDNRDDSSDSRFWGLVPEDHIVGKAVVTYFSWNAVEGRARLERLFRWVD